VGDRYPACPAKEKEGLEGPQVEGIIEDFLKKTKLKHQTNNVKIGKLDNLFTRYEEAAR